MQSAASPTPVFTPAATRKATAFTIVFAILGALRLRFGPVDTATELQSALLFLFILLNTFPSIRLFQAIGPKGDLIQSVVDLALGLLYLWMTLMLGDPIRFAFATAVMFGVACLKYVLLLQRISQSTLLRHKLVVDVIGTLGAIVALGGSVLWRADTMFWLWMIGFGLAQIDIFLIHPLYVLHRERS